MRTDLLDAIACIDWTDAQLPSFQQRIDAWVDLNFYVEVKDVDPGQPNNVIVALRKEPPPAFFNVEFGAIINTIRSSLDILATTLANRYGMARPDKVYFPIAKSAADFTSMNFKGSEFIQALPKPQRQIVEDLKPYCGGNERLWLIHHLDIVRKHRRLLTVVCLPSRFQIIGWGIAQHYTAISNGFMPVSDAETVVGLIAKGAPHYDMKATGCLAIDETGPLIRKPAIAALTDFSCLARSIIELFDDA